MAARSGRVPLKEPFNAVSHMIGAGIAVAALPILVLGADGALAVVCAAVYGTSLLAVFTMSVLFHGVRRRASAWLFRMDQSMIYLLIAGTYTPLTLLLVGGALGWSLFAFEWGAAVAGIAVLLTVHRTAPWVHQAAYIVLGWTALFALPQIMRLHWPALALVIGGGVAYSGGATLYWRDRPTTWLIGDHGIWHVLVLAGSIAHVVFVLLYVL